MENQIGKEHENFMETGAIGGPYGKVEGLRYEVASSHKSPAPDACVEAMLVN